MAERILSVQYLTASVSTVEIDLPKLWVKEKANAAAWGGQNGVMISGSQWYPSDRIKYHFSPKHSGSIELCQESGDIAGIYVPADTVYETDGFRLIAGPPRFLYSHKPGGEPCRVTVVLIR